VGGQRLVGFAGDVAFEAADDLSGRLALAGAPGHVGLGARVGGDPGEDDPPQGGVGLPAAAAVEAVAALLAGGGVDRAGAAQRGETCLGAQPAGVVAGGDLALAGAGRKLNLPRESVHVLAFLMSLRGWSEPKPRTVCFQMLLHAGCVEVLRSGMCQLTDLLVTFASRSRSQHITEPECGECDQFLHESSL
jgi:hypothetical protein